MKQIPDFARWFQQKAVSLQCQIKTNSSLFINIKKYLYGKD